MSKCILGIDTSNYRTSVSLVDLNQNIILNERKLLDVKQGELGLQQSYALFQHLKNLPDLIEKSSNVEHEIAAVAVSVKPRNVSGSYMPVFLAGETVAESIASVLKVPCYKFSHQEGHFASARLHTPIKDSDRYIAFHLSGGTTEAVLIENGNFSIVGGTLDIALGQLIDRVGVKLGYSFPAGKYLDKLMNTNLEKVQKINMTPVKIKDGFFNLSGFETQMYKLIDADLPNIVIVNTLFNEILSLLNKSMKFFNDRYSIDKFLFAGGVSSSKYIQNKINAYFAKEELSGDNAVGIAVLGGIQYGKEAGNNFTTK